MTVKELKELLEQFDDELEVMYKLRPSIGNVGEIYHAYKSEYSFFGKSLPCVLLDSATDSVTNLFEFCGIPWIGPEDRLF